MLPKQIPGPQGRHKDGGGGCWLFAVRDGGRKAVTLNGYQLGRRDYIPQPSTINHQPSPINHLLPLPAFDGDEQNPAGEDEVRIDRVVFFDDHGQLLHKRVKVPVHHRQLPAAGIA